MKPRNRIIFFVTVIAFLTVAAISATQPDLYFLIKKNFTIFSKTYENVAIEYVDEVNPESLMREGMKAMLETLDPYTVLYDEAQNEQAEILSRGNYAGIGVEAGYRDGRVVVIAPTEGGPAQKKGIKAGDIITAIDGVSTSGLQPDEVQVLTLGEVGSSVTLQIERYGIDQALEFELVRERIEVKNISYTGFVGNGGNVGYIRLTQFGIRSADEIRTAILELSNQKEMKGLILDLRDNPGGLLNEAVSIVDKFVEPGITIVETRGRIPDYNSSYTTEEPVMFKKPMVVLLNGGSASASEVVSGALQDLDRAVIVGERSFGKGLVQIVKPLPYNTSLKITISRYYIPSGRSIQSIAYTHEGRMSSVVKPDSLSRVFKTRNNRPVYEGRGIDPDVAVPLPDMGLLEIALIQGGSYFDFATQYMSENPSFDENTVDDRVYQAFLTFLQNSDFDYKTDAEVLLEELSGKTKGVQKADTHIRAIWEALQKEKKNQLTVSENTIRNKLYLELLSRAKGEKAKTTHSLGLDPQVIEAVNLINNPPKIETILAGQK